VIDPVNDDGCCFSLNDRRTFQEVAGAQIRKRIDRNFTPLTEERLSTSDRSAARRQWHRSLSFFWTGNCADAATRWQSLQPRLVLLKDQ
jgi:hypothetical protein